MPTKTPTKSASSSLVKGGKSTTRKAGNKPVGPVAKEHGSAKQNGHRKAATREVTTNQPNGIARQTRQDIDIEYFRNLLLQERTRLEEEREQIRSSALDVDGALPDEGEGAEEDTADLASSMMDKEMNLSVEDEIEDLLAAIDHAMQKIDDGTYGICDMSGEPIPAGRLELIPWASLTVECQALSEE